MANNNEMMNNLFSMLNNGDAKNQISDLISNLGGSNSQNNSSPPNDAPFQSQSSNGSSSGNSNNMFGNNMDAMVKIQSMMSAFNNQDDNRIYLLNAIRPYMRETRNKNIDMAVKFIQLMNFSSQMRNK